MRFVGDKPNNPYEPPNGQFGSGYSPGAIRNTLGSGLKASGFFQKDGQIQNMRGGFIGAKQPSYTGNQWQGPPVQGGSNYMPGQTLQLILQAAQEGINGNGVATISPDNNFLLIANLPPPQAFLGYGQQGVYAAYLVDEKGKTGFLAGSLRQVGNGVYRTQFQSPVPLHHYPRAIVSVENPTQLGQVPNGPIILKVKDPMGVMTFLRPMRNTASTVWGKITGLFGGGKKAPLNPEIPAMPPVQTEAAPISPELLQSLNQMGINADTPAGTLPPSTPPMSN